MITTRMYKLIAVVLLLAVCGVLTANYYRDCNDDSCVTMCSHASTTVALIDDHSIGIDFQSSAHLSYDPYYLPQISPTDVFQPPRATV